MKSGSCMAGYRVKFTYFTLLCQWNLNNVCGTAISFRLSLASRTRMANLLHRESFWLPIVICIQICKLRAIPINFGPSMRKPISPTHTPKSKISLHYRCIVRTWEGIHFFLTVLILHWHDSVNRAVASSAVPLYISLSLAMCGLHYSN